MSDLVSRWEELLDELRQQRTGQDPARTREVSAFAADWLAAGEDVALSPPPPGDRAGDAFEPYLSLLRIFGRLDRALSDMLYRRTYAEEPALLGSEFGDWAVGSLARETYLDLQMAALAFYNGLDLQAMCLLRQMSELSWRALIVAAEPEVADEWWESIVGGTESSERTRLEKRLWQRHFRPAAMLRHIAEIEARLEGAEGEAAEALKRETIARESAIYTLLSGTTHGGAELVFASAVRGTGTRLPVDPFARIGQPTDLGTQIVTAALHLQTRFWRYFPLAAFPDALDEDVPPKTAEGALALAACAVVRLADTHYPGFVTL